LGYPDLEISSVGSWEIPIHGGNFQLAMFDSWRGEKNMFHVPTLRRTKDWGIFDNESLALIKGSQETPVFNGKNLAFWQCSNGQNTWWPLKSQDISSDHHISSYDIYIHICSESIANPVTWGLRPTRQNPSDRFLAL
jgi:hypothetical protein